MCSIIYQFLVNEPTVVFLHVATARPAFNIRKRSYIRNCLARTGMMVRVHALAVFGIQYLRLIQLAVTAGSLFCGQTIFVNIYVLKFRWSKLGVMVAGILQEIMCQMSDTE